MSGRTPDQILAEFGAELERARPRRVRPSTAAFTAVAAALALWAVLSLASAPPDDEAVATPTPMATETPTPEPARSWPLKLDPPARDGSETKVMQVKPLDVVPLRKRPEVITDLNVYEDRATLERAWSVPQLGGDVYLERTGVIRCLSVPDSATARPQVERARSCGTTVSLTLNYDYVAFDLDFAQAPELQFPDGRREDVVPSSGGLVAVTRVPPGSSLTRYPRDAKPHTDRIDGGPFQWRCPDGRIFWLLPQQLPGGEPCTRPPNRTGG
jgi:hypothetical protein